MVFQTIFKRYEIKYCISLKQKETILKAMQPYMEIDKYGRTTIRNIYFDTDNYRLIRRSIEKPTYKEKLRVRSYAQATVDSTVFVELKKKCNGIVYKRRIAMTDAQATKWLNGESNCPCDTQISREIDYFRRYYGNLSPKVFLSYEREAYFEKSGGSFRVTFDENIICRQNDLSLTKEPGGKSILEKGKVIMEIKCSGGIPLWMTEVLSREGIYKTSFSKYGVAYQTLIFPGINQEISKNKKETLIYA